MRIRFFLVMVLAILLTPSLKAQTQQGTGSYSGNLSVGGAPTYPKGWFLYWPAEAMKQPRLPMPYPWWPNQAAPPQSPRTDPVPPPSDAPNSNPGQPPAQFHLPRDTQSLPALPGPVSWGQPYGMPFQPVSYPYSAPPAYWYGR